jgi:hypothetical protein
MNLSEIESRSAAPLNITIDDSSDESYSPQKLQTSNSAWLISTDADDDNLTARKDPFFSSTNFARLRRQIIVYSNSRAGKLYTATIYAISFISCFQYIHSTYLEKDGVYFAASRRLELAFAIMFGLDWCYRFIVADDKVIFIQR